MSRFDTASSYLQGFGSGQSVVDRGVQNADAMQSAVARQQQLQLAQQQHGLSQQEHDLRLHEFDWRTSQAVQNLEKQHQRAAIVGNLGLTLLKQKPSASQIDPMTGAAVGNPDNPVDDTISHWIQTGIDTGNADALEKMIPRLQTAQQRQDMVNKIKYVKENGFGGSLANPDEKAIADLAEVAASPQMLERGLSMKVARQHHEQQDAAKAQALADQKSQQERQANEMATKTLPADGAEPGNVSTFDQSTFEGLMNQDPKMLAAAYSEHMARQARGGLAKKDVEDQAWAASPIFERDWRSLQADHPQMNDAQAQAAVWNKRRRNENEQAAGAKGTPSLAEPTVIPDPTDPTGKTTIHSWKGKDTPLDWNPNDPIVQHFMVLAKGQAQEADPQNKPGIFSHQDVEDWKQRVAANGGKPMDINQVAQDIAKKKGFVISGAGAQSPQNDDMKNAAFDAFRQSTGRKPDPLNNDSDAQRLVEILKARGANPQQIKAMLQGN